MTVAGRGLIISAPSSGSGKTLATLGLLRALSRREEPVRAAKSGPDYIDPRFHEAACGAPCLNLDAWAMPAARLRALAEGPGLLLIEGAMGLFDGAPPDGQGATADLARHLGVPVVLVIDAGRMAQSIAAIASGFAAHDPEVTVVGVILNRVGSARHETMLRRALAASGIRCFGALPRLASLEMPDRHLGLVQAAEHPALEAFIETAAQVVSDHLDLAGIAQVFAPLPSARPADPPPPPAQRIAVARDMAFGFTYPHLVADWQRAGATITLFSPLVDDTIPEADLIFLPGGYPELHAGRIAGAQRFLASLRQRAADGAAVYGECGGYMVLGEGLIDATGQRHQMAGLLPLETSFAERRLQLGYRQLHSGTGPFQGEWNGHEFHYTTTLRAEGKPLFTATDAENAPLPPMGIRRGNVCGSFAHLIERRVG